MAPPFSAPGRALAVHSTGEADDPIHGVRLAARGDPRARTCAHFDHTAARAREPPGLDPRDRPGERSRVRKRCGDDHGAAAGITRHRNENDGRVSQESARHRDGGEPASFARPDQGRRIRFHVGDHRRRGRRRRARDRPLETWTGAGVTADAQGRFRAQAGIAVPLICGPMYPCSNPELVAAASEAGAIGIVQPVSLTYVHGHEYREGLRYIRRLTSKPIGFNALIEASSRLYFERMVKWIDIALEEGVRFFITSLGNPKWVCERVHAVGGVVYHDVTERKWAQKAIDGGVDGLIAVNNRAGGHAGGLSPAQLYDELASFEIPLVSAGGVGTPREFTADLT